MRGVWEQELMNSLSLLLMAAARDWILVTETNPCPLEASRNQRARPCGNQRKWGLEEIWGVHRTGAPPP